MSTVYDKYEAVIGLEVHAQLNTKSKAFSSDKNEYGELPNHLVSAISLGHPGTLPRLNQRSAEFAVALGIACKCDIRNYNKFARKNYFYADLPKGYQITQFDTPICTNGFVPIKLSDGTEKSIGLTRIHMEEDTGKSIHDQDPFNTLLDFNRAGVPLIEIVTEPDLRSDEDAYQFLIEIRKLVRYLEICDGNMEEGSMRCDANVSVRIKGVEAFGQKVEVKNMNSIRNVQRAIQYEIKRHIDIIEAGERVAQDTRTFNAVDGSTTSMRSKEAANDYRYFTEPDLQPLMVTTEQIKEIKDSLPPIPRELFLKYTKELGLSDYDALVLTESKELALFYEDVLKHTSNAKSAANWVMIDVKSFLNENALHISEFPLNAKHIAEIISIIDEGKLSNSAAKQRLFPALCQSPSDPLSLAKSLDLIQESDDDSLEVWINAVIASNPDEVKRFQAGEKKLTGFFMGQLMKVSKGKADPKKSNKLLRELLEKA